MLNIMNFLQKWEMFKKKKVKENYGFEENKLLNGKIVCRQI